MRNTCQVNIALNSKHVSEEDRRTRSLPPLQLQSNHACTRNSRPQTNPGPSNVGSKRLACRHRSLGIHRAGLDTIPASEQAPRSGALAKCWRSMKSVNRVCLPLRLSGAEGTQSEKMRTSPTICTRISACPSICGRTLHLHRSQRLLRETDLSIRMRGQPFDRMAAILRFFNPWMEPANPMTHLYEPRGAPAAPVVDAKRVGRWFCTSEICFDDYKLIDSSRGARRSLRHEFVVSTRPPGLSSKHGFLLTGSSIRRKFRTDEGRSAFCDLYGALTLNFCLPQFGI